MATRAPERHPAVDPVGRELDTDGRGPEVEQRRILLLGTHGQANVGDELLLATFLEHLGAGHRYVVNSYEPDETRAQFGDRYELDVIDTAADRSSLLRHLFGCDAVVFGGGSIVKELYASVGRWRYATLVMVLGVVWLARLARRPVLMCGVGVGPIESRFGRLLARLALRSVDLVSVRDQASFDTAHSLGVRADRLALVPDTVFVNSPECFATPRPEVGRSREGRVRIALNLNRDIANGARWDDVLDELATALDHVARRIPIEVHALPMQSRGKDHDDLTVLRLFLAGRPGWRPVIHEPHDHRDVGRIIADCDVVVSERLHAIVIASILATPAIALSYDVKVTELADQLGIADRSVDINEPFDPSELAASIIGTIERADIEGERLGGVAALLRARVARQFDDITRWLADPREHRRWEAAADDG